MLRHDDKIHIKITNSQHFTDYEFVEVKMRYGDNPLDMIGEPEVPRQKSEKYTLFVLRFHRTTHFDPFVERMMQHYELRSLTNENKMIIYGNSTSIQQCWIKMLQHGQFIPKTEISP
jgi:hypothetical protein